MPTPFGHLSVTGVDGNRRVMWSGDDTPYVVVTSVVMSCQCGPDSHRARKQKAARSSLELVYLHRLIEVFSAALHAYPINVV